MRVRISQFILLVMLLLTFALPGPLQTSSDNRLQRSVYPVKKLSTNSPSVADIEFDDFEFNRLQMSRYGPMPWEIPGQPAKNTYYYVEPAVYGEDAITTAKFEAIDEHGALISVIPILQRNGADGRPEFSGMMVAPDRPFRVVVSGQAVDGQSYRVVHQTLFVPTDVPEKWDPKIIQHTKGANVKKKIALLEDRMRQEYLKVKQEFEKLQGGMIIMPRTRVSNVNYAALLSPSGQPRGVRITYDAEFSQPGYYNPSLQLYFDYKNSEWRGTVEMYALNSSLEPPPTEESPQERPHPLADDAGYTYLANTTYHFTLELVPNYVVQNEQKTKFCLNNQRFNHDPLVRARWEAILASKEWTSLRVSIQNSDFEGVIENFYPQHVLYDTFVADGARDCGAQPTIRF